VPDFYQGTDLWDFNLVDPDNRRPVDYERRLSMLRKIQTTGDKLDLATLLRRWSDGRVKMYVTWKLLELRGRRAEALQQGAYEPLDAGKNVCAFSRGGEVIVGVPRFVSSLVKPGAFPLGDVWGAAALAGVDGKWRNIFTGDTIDGDSITLASMFERFPVAVLERA
jgi:(1->4)-alpha-D-glucan 1-alpha-D-glucosylmutase